MTLETLDNLDTIKKFLEGNQAIAFSMSGYKKQRYQFVQKTLVQFSYITASKSVKGLIRRYLAKVTVYSRPQLTRLFSQYQQTGRIEWRPASGNCF